MTPREREYILSEIISAASMIATIWLIKKMQQTDSGRVFRMTISRAVKRFAQDQADSWQKVADIAATSYQKARL